MSDEKPVQSKRLSQKDAGDPQPARPPVPQYFTPAQLVAEFDRMGISVKERTIREHAKRIGAFSMIGKAMALDEQDVSALLESFRAKPRQGLAKPSVEDLVPGATWEEAMAHLQKRASSKKRPG